MPATYRKPNSSKDCDLGSIYIKVWLTIIIDLGLFKKEKRDQMNFIHMKDDE